MSIRHTLAALLIVALPVAVFAEPPPGSPPGIAPAVAMTDRPADMIALDASRKPVEVLKFLELKRGDQVLDVMGGQGYYSEIIGNAIGSKGRVIVLEPPAYMDDAKVKAGWEALIKRVPNVGLQVAVPADVKLAPASIDFVLMHLTYHDAYWESAKYKFPRLDPATFLGKIYAATKPGGIVGVIDHVGTPGAEPRGEVEKTHRIDPAVIKADFAKAGFVLEAESTLLANPADDHNKLVFDPAVRGTTDRVIYRFRRPKG
ncbi:MAG: class I SAM-dependent methyltransferase [Polymorphobacter sp.]